LSGSSKPIKRSLIQLPNPILLYFGVPLQSELSLIERLNIKAFIPDFGELRKAISKFGDVRNTRGSHGVRHH
jgi:hypothetical protein